MHCWSQTALTGFSHLACVRVCAAGKQRVYQRVCGTENLEGNSATSDMHAMPFWLPLRHINSLIDAIKAQKERKLLSEATVSCCHWPTFCSFFLHSSGHPSFYSVFPEPHFLCFSLHHAYFSFSHPCLHLENWCFASGQVRRYIANLLSTSKLT